MMSRGVGTIAGAVLLALTLSSVLVGKDRVPVATGEYEILLGGKRIGQEEFTVFKDKKYEVWSEATLYWPEPTHFELRYELGTSFQPQTLELQLARGGEVREMQLKRHKEDWRSEVKGKGRRKVREELGSREGAEVDFDSPIFNGYIVRRLSLNPGEERVIDVVVFQLSDLSGQRARHTYRRLDDGDVETKALGRVPGSAYELVNGETVHQFWTDPSGVVLLMRTELAEGDLEYELVRLEAKADAWQPVQD